MEHKGRAKLKTKRAKEVISSQKRLYLLRKAKHNQPLIPLDKPVHHGWERYFVLRSDLTHSKNAKVLTIILGMINNFVHSRTKDFTYKHWKTKKSFPVIQNLNRLTDKQGQELEPSLQKWFVRTKFFHEYSKQPFYNWVFTHPQFFVFRIRPYFLTHKQLVDSEVESEIAFLNDWIYNERRYRLLEGFRAYWKDDYNNAKSVKDRKLDIAARDQLNEY